MKMRFHLFVILTVSVLLTHSLSPANAEDKPVDEEMRAAEIRAKQTEVEYLKARVELDTLRHQKSVAKMQERIAVLEQGLAAANPPLPSDEGFIHNWLVLGPIHIDEKVNNHDEASCKEFLDRLYVPMDATPADGEIVKIDDVDFKWLSANASEYFLDLSKLAEDNSLDATNSAMVGVVYINSEEELSNVTLSIEIGRAHV